MVKFSEQAENIIRATREMLGDRVAKTVARLYCMGRCDGGLHVVRGLPSPEDAVLRLQELKEDFEARMDKEAT